MFYTMVDKIFDEIMEKYGMTEELINMKEQLIDVYQNEDKIKAKHIHNQIKPINFIINKDSGSIEIIE